MFTLIVFMLIEDDRRGICDLLHDGENHTLGYVACAICLNGHSRKKTNEERKEGRDKGRQNKGRRRADQTREEKRSEAERRRKEKKEKRKEKGRRRRDRTPEDGTINNLACK